MERSEIAERWESKQVRMWAGGSPARSGGRVAKIEEAPVFINGEISWRLKTEETPT